MNHRGIAWGALAALLAGCAPYRLEYNHLVLEALPGLSVEERSVPAAKPGEEIKAAVYELPIRSTLQRPGYTVVIHTPLGGEVPLIFVGARSVSGESLTVDGRYISPVHPDARVLYPDSPFAFLFAKAHGAPIELAIHDASGAVIGTETLRYRVVRRGVAWGVEWI